MIKRSLSVNVHIFRRTLLVCGLQGNRNIFFCLSNLRLQRSLTIFSENKLDIAAVDSITKIEPTKDIDFRVLPTNTITTPSGLSSILSITSGSNDPPSTVSIKRASEERSLNDEPLAKKTKSEEIE